MNLSLPTPNAADLLALRNDRPAFIAAVELQRDLAKAVGKLLPETLAAIAVQHMPGATRLEAIGNLQAKFADFNAAISDFNNLAVAARNEYLDKIKPVFDRVSRRHFEINHDLGRIKSRIESAKSVRKGSIKALVDAGASQSQAEAIILEQSNQVVAELVAEHDALVAENETIRCFLKSKNLSDLPQGFSL